MHGQRQSARRAVVLVLDACGAGALPDAELYGDAGTNTLGHLAEAVGGLRLPTLERLGLGSILPLEGLSPAVAPAIHGRLHPLGPGKDSTAGHWEMMGVVLERSQPTYPEGLPKALRQRLSAAIGRELICNLPRNGISAIEQFGEEHVSSGALILYTSQDSVLQLAAHVEVVPPQQLYEACRIAREQMQGQDAVGRVIARPFTGVPGAFERTGGRRDFSLAPPGRSYLQELAEREVPIHGVGKVFDLFAEDPAMKAHPGSSNAVALREASRLLDELDAGFVFVNLIETDQVYGHRKDVEGFHRALQAIDAEVGRWLPRLRDEDLLILTADHGVDPAHPLSDHTREHAPLLALTGAMLREGGPLAIHRRDAHCAQGARPLADCPGEAHHDGPLADVGATVLGWLTGGVADELPGRSFLEPNGFRLAKPVGATVVGLTGGRRDA